jgi:DNA primase
MEETKTSEETKDCERGGLKVNHPQSSPSSPNARNILELLSDRGYRPKKRASTKGGEWAGPCPFCREGEDRFRVWPSQGREGIGRYWCRRCGKRGDAIQLVRELDGTSFREACKSVGIALKRPPRRPKRLIESLPGKPQILQDPAVLPVHELPNEMWTERAEKLVELAHRGLLDDRSTLQWFGGRGIGFGTVCLYRLGVLKQDYWRPREVWGLGSPKQGKKRLWIPSGVVIPVAAEGGRVCRVRIRRFEGDPRYFIIPGSWMGSWVIGAGKRGVVVVESELDALVVEEKAGDLVEVLALGSATSRPSAAVFERLKRARRILCALDFDAAGAKAWRWWERNFPDNAMRFPTPVGKDPGEAFAAGVDVRTWVEIGLE